MNSTPTHADMIRRQIEDHPLVRVGEFNSAEDQCLFLIHCKPYEEAREVAKGKAVLDVGCNVGYGTAILARDAASAVGVDVSERAIADARRRYPHVRYEVVDGSTLPFEDDSFDLVTSVQVIEHVGDYDVYMSEIRRVLAPGGVVFFATPNARIRLDPGMPPWNTTHFREFAAEELRELLLGYFGQVEVLGMFGEEPLYSLEYNRAQRALHAARNADLPPEGESPPGLLRRLVRAVVPAPLRHKIYAARQPKPEPFTPLDNTTADLFYRRQDLDRAIDLLAICRGQEPGSPCT